METSPFSISSASNLTRILSKNSPELLQKYQRGLEISKELRRRKENNKAKYYVPNGKAEEFIKLVGSDDKFVCMFVGANGTSKTSTGANIIANIVYGVQSEWFQHPLFQNFPYIKKGRIVSDPTTLKEKIVPELEKWFPANESNKIPHANYETAKEGKNYVSKFHSNTGWDIDLMSNEQDVKEFESVDLGFVWFDEPPPKVIFLATIARARLGMIIIMTFTPLNYSAWIKDWMNDHVGTEADYVEAEAEDNCKVHGVRGHFEHKHIKRIADSYPEAERQARVFGKFGHLLGRVHQKFSRKIHVIRPFPINEMDYTTYVALDPHPRVQDHVMYMSVDKKGRKFITGEILSEGLPKQLSARMRAFEQAMNYRMEDRIIDPSAYNDDQHREDKSVGSQMFDLKMHFIKGSKDLMAGIKRTDQALDYQMVQGKMVRPPELYVFDTCPVTIKQMEEYVWDEYKGKGSDEKQAKGRPKDKMDHQPENLHRLLLHEPQFYPYEMRNVPIGGGMVGINAVATDEFDPYHRG